MSTIPKQMPAGFAAYGRSPDFTPDNLPARLKSAHSTKPGVWGLIHVLSGKILYQLEAPHQGEQLASAGDHVIIESEVPHHVEFIEPGRIFVEFYRAAEPPR